MQTILKNRSELIPVTGVVFTKKESDVKLNLYAYEETITNPGYKRQVMSN
jgi:hypothetical protein